MYRCARNLLDNFLEHVCVCAGKASGTQASAGSVWWEPTHKGWLSRPSGASAGQPAKGGGGPADPSPPLQAAATEVRKFRKQRGRKGKESQNLKSHSQNSLIQIFSVKWYSSGLPLFASACGLHCYSTKTPIHHIESLVVLGQGWRATCSCTWHTSQTMGPATVGRQVSTPQKRPAGRWWALITAVARRSPQHRWVSLTPLPNWGKGVTLFLN